MFIAIRFCNSLECLLLRISIVVGELIFCLKVLFGLFYLLEENLIRIEKLRKCFMEKLRQNYKGWMNCC